MKMLCVPQSPPLQGEVRINTSKNSMLPILAACLLTKDEVILHDVPCLTDVRWMGRLLQALGVRITRQERTWVIGCTALRTTNAPPDLVQRLRASFLVTGPLLARCGKVTIPFPGGCSIGSRPVDMHLRGCACWVRAAGIGALPWRWRARSCGATRFIWTIPAWGRPKIF